MSRLKSRSITPLTFAPTYRRGGAELVLLGADLAISEAAGADFTAVLVVAYNLATGERRVLYACRRKGLSLKDQLDLFADLAVRYVVDVGVVEQNGFAGWLLEALRDRPETRGRFVGQNTGQEKTDFRVGVPGLKIALLEQRWTMPSGDEESSVRPGVAGRAKRLRLEEREARRGSASTTTR